MSTITFILPRQGYISLLVLAGVVLSGVAYLNLRQKATAPQTVPPAAVEKRAEAASIEPSAVVASLPATAHTLSDWLVLRPISANIYVPPLTDKQGAANAMGRILDTAYLSNEGSIHPKAGDDVTIRGHQLTWAVATADMLDLSTGQNAQPKAIASGSPANAVGYAVAYVDEPATVADATLYVGSDDGVEVWLNGKSIHRVATIRNAAPGNDIVPHLSLNAGRNTFVFKVGQAEGKWMLTASLDTH